MVAVHRLIVENNINRYLLKDEQVHHKNRNKLDNRIDNLEVLTINKHRRLHATEDSPNRGQRKHEYNLKMIVSLRKDDKYANEISEITGIPRRTIQRYLKQVGLGGHKLKVERRKRNKLGRFI